MGLHPGQEWAFPKQGIGAGSLRSEGWHDEVEKSRVVRVQTHIGALAGA